MSTSSTMDVYTSLYNDTVTPIDYRTDNRYWRKHRSREPILISDMKDEHLKATIAMVERGHDYLGRDIPEWCNEKLPYLREEAARRHLYIKESGWDE